MPAWAVAALLWAGCLGAPPRELGELVLQDSTYLDPATMLPYSGAVVRSFRGGGLGDGGGGGGGLGHGEGGADRRLELEATLLDGVWEGEFTVYHETGRVRYEGEMSAGVPCGAWVEQENPVEPESVYEAIKQDLESLVMYPECG